MRTDTILVTGATGYVGGRLIPALLDAGYRVRAMGRSVDKLGCRPWSHHERVELVQGDVLDLESLKKAARGCWAAYYLVHSMIAQKDKFVEADRKAARNMVHAAETAGLERIIYSGFFSACSNPLPNPSTSPFWQDLNALRPSCTRPAPCRKEDHNRNNFPFPGKVHL